MINTQILKTTQTSTYVHKLRMGEQILYFINPLDISLSQSLYPCPFIPVPLSFSLYPYPFILFTLFFVPFPLFIFLHPCPFIHVPLSLSLYSYCFLPRYPFPIQIKIIVSFLFTLIHYLNPIPFIPIPISSFILYIYYVFNIKSIHFHWIKYCSNTVQNIVQLLVTVHCANAVQIMSKFF